MEEKKKILTDRDECLTYIKTAFAGNIDLDIISEDLKHDPEIIEQAIMNNQNLINKFSSILTEGFYSKQMTNLFDKFGSELLTRISPELKENPKFMEKVITAYPNAYYYLNDKLKCNMSFMKACEEKLEIAIQKYEKLGDKDYSEFVRDIKNKIAKDNLDNAQNILGIDNEKYNLIKHYPGTLEKLSNISSLEQSNLFKVCLENINSKNLDLAEWTNAFNNLINRFNEKDYQELLGNIDVQNVDIEQLNKILEQPNYFNIRFSEEVEKYQEIKGKACDAIINQDEKTISNFPLIAKMDNIDRMKFAVLEKLMGYDLAEAQNISNKFLCIEDVKATDTNDIKSWVTSLKKIVNLNNEDVLKRLYSLTPVPVKSQNKLILEQEAKKLYMQEYNKTLFNPENANRLNDEELKDILPEGVDKDRYKFIDAGTDFNMIMTVIGAFSGKIDQNYSQEWNKEITSSTGISCSYIGNDMIATAPIKNICYGFIKMEDDSLELSGDCDIFSCHLADPIHNNELYLPDNKLLSYNTPDNLKINTIESNAETTGYNEMVFSRIQEGKRKQPDYLIVFKIGNQIKGVEQSCKAADDFREEGIELPIVVVDVERCLTNEMQKAQEMVEQAKDYDDIEKVENILRTNKKTVAFASRECYNGRVDTNIYREMLKKVWSKAREVSSKLYEMRKKGDEPKVHLQSYNDSYQTTTVEERNNTASKIVQLQKKIMRETQCKGGEIDER